MKLEPDGICDRCAQRYLLSELKEIRILGRGTGLLVCPDDWEPSHPQLDVRKLRTNDKQSVPNSRSDAAELDASRSLTGSFNTFFDDWA